MPRNSARALPRTCSVSMVCVNELCPPLVAQIGRGADPEDVTRARWDATAEYDSGTGYADVLHGGERCPECDEVGERDAD